MKTTTKNKKSITKMIWLFLCLATSGIATAQCNLSFTYSTGSAGLVNFTNTSTGLTGSPVYAWSLGYQNQTSGATSPSFTYPFNGTYTVTLAINDSFNVCTSTTQTITINNTANQPPCNAAFTTSNGTSGQVTFTNTSATYTASTSNYSWTYGDGQYDYNVTSPVHNYFYNNSYVVTLNLNNAAENCFTSTTQTVTVNNANTTPTCSVAITYTTGANGLVNFSNNYFGPPATTTYNWSFGVSGAYSNISSPSFTYPYNGTFTVTLNVMDSLNSGGCSANATATVVVTNTVNCVTPTASFVMHADSLNAGVWQAIASYAPQIVSANWNWGDGTPVSAGLSPAHTYSTSGWYTICLTAYNTCGDSVVYCSTDSVYHMASLISVQVINSTATGINNVQTENASLSFFPNPNTGQFTLNMQGIDKNSSSVDLTITSLVGQNVLQTKLPVTNGVLVKEIHLQDVSDGVYFVKINSGTSIYTKRIIVKK